ncbi:hypothetical protein [Methylobacterium sp. J-076]|uniref:hypothetical protein n=1 Tax=Methylobacterium sp. J-076 TaxID=2836655 RepID=UPI001FBBFECC|nr:hypothetical protein [Methylobacterium sp. J-076]MCJ2011098.1 hypothetical protein [Methylobacterium sp. J-076]
MTDAGGFLPGQDTSGAAERTRLLRQIATALDLPVSAFTRAPPAPEVEGPSSAECAAMLAAFSKIRDPQMRAFCVQVLETFAERR